MHTLTPEEEIALRRIANQSLSVEPKLAGRLAQLKLAERLKDGWRLTPLGRHQYERLARPPLLVQRHPAYIDRLLDRAIPMARAAGIPLPDPVPESAEENGSKPSVPVQTCAPVAVFAESEELRAGCSKALSEYRDRALHVRSENGNAVAKSRATLNRSWLLLIQTTRMVR